MSDGPGYSIEGLQHGMERCNINIERLELAIENERKTIASYKVMIDDLQRAQKDHTEAKRMSRTIEVGREPRGDTD